MFYKKGDSIYSEEILDEVCKDMNIQPTYEVQDFFAENSIKYDDSIFYEEVSNKINCNKYNDSSYKISESDTIYYNSDPKTLYINKSRSYINNKNLKIDILLTEAA
jgi:hypothetical protein